MNRVLTLTLLASLLLHLFIAVGFWLVAKPNQSQPAKPSPVVREFTLATIPPAQDDLPPPPEHNTDDPSQANNQNGLNPNKPIRKMPSPSANVAPASASPASTSIRHEPQPSDLPKPITSTQGEYTLLNTSEQESKLKSIFGENWQEEKNSENPSVETQSESSESTPDNALNALSDSALDEEMVENPLDDNQEALRKWYNEVYKRLEEQVAEVWVKPDDANPYHRGVIKLELDLQGYLNRAWVHLPSGHKGLDQSALNAIRAILRYQIPESPNMARYYLNLEFRYSGNTNG